MTAAPRVHHYADGEFMLAFGPKETPQILVLQPLFEEMNRCRAFVTTLCRMLALREIGCWLPDLPGTGESLAALETVTWSRWTDAIETATTLVAAETGRSPLTLSVRGGALVEAAGTGKRWRLSPTSGRSLLSDLRRSALAGGGDPSCPAGYRLNEDLVAKLESRTPPEGVDIRTVRLRSDDREADHHIDGSPIWRRPEPVSDAEMTAAVAHDVLAWAKI